MDERRTEPRGREDLERRVHELERRGRWLGTWAISSMALCLGACLTAALAPEERVLRARTYVLVDAEGREVGALGAGDQGGQLALWETDRSGGVVLGAGALAVDGAHHTGAYVWDEVAGETGGSLSLSTAGRVPRLVLSGGPASVELEVAGGAGALRLRDGEGATVELP